MEVRVTHNGELVVRELQQLAGRLADVRPALDQFGEHMLNVSVPQNFREGGRPDKWDRSPWALREPQKDTGRLMRSVRYETTRGRFRIGSNHKAARLRQEGGVIRPRKADALVIPLPDVPRNMRRPRRWGKRLFMLRSKTGSSLGVLATRDGDGVKAQFVLRRQVEQKARPFILFHDEDIRFLHAELAAHAAGDAS